MTIYSICVAAFTAFIAGLALFAIVAAAIHFFGHMRSRGNCGLSQEQWRNSCSPCGRDFARRDWHA